MTLHAGPAREWSDWAQLATTIELAGTRTLKGKTHRTETRKEARRLPSRFALIAPRWGAWERGHATLLYGRKSVPPGESRAHFGATQRTRRVQRHARSAIPTMPPHEKTLRLSA
jgi:hypothetical protein